jgi:beta-phosphoglucomutase-like phosphatase (HAD superfamily)
MNTLNKEKEIMNFQNKHFLFDFDGVISQSSYALFEAWRFAFREIANVDIEKSEEEYYLMEGVGLQKTIEILGNKYNVNPSNYQSIIELKDDYFKKNYTFTVYDGVYEIINILKDKGAKMALVTGAKKYRILENVPKNFIDQFDVLITSDETLNTKPDPEPYIKAAKLLDVKSKDCVVVENSPVGIQAAKSAGMFVIALKTTLSEYHLSSADLILESIADLLKIIK